MRSQRAELLFGALHLAVLSAFAVAQPLFDLLGKNAEFFAVRGSASGDIVIFALILVLAPPLVLLAVEVVAAAVSARLRTGVHFVFVAGLAALIVLPIIKDAGTDSSGVLLPLAALLGIAIAFLYTRTEPARTFLTVLSPVPALFLIVFLFFSSAGDLVTGGQAEARTSDVDSTTPVVMLVLDELPVTSLLGPDGRIDSVRYPNFARLADDSYWFPNASTVDTQTTIAVPSLLTGKRAKKRTLPIFQDHQENLFTLLGGSYRLNVDESITRLCPEDLCGRKRESFGARMESLARDSTVVSLHLLLPDDMRRDLPSIDSGWSDFRGGPDLGASERRTNTTASQLEAEIQRQGPDQNRRTVVDRFTRSLGPSGADRPTLSFSHLLLPHGPWQYLPDGSLYGQGERVGGLSEEKWVSAQAADTAYQRHLLQLGFLDRQLGKVLRRLRATGAYDESLLVVTSDHGISFTPGQPRRVISATNATDLMPVPLIIKAPRQRRGRIIERHVQTIDVVPTIADLLDIEVPWRMDGRSALAPGTGRTTLRAASFSAGAVTLSSAELERRRGQALRRKLRLFGSGLQSPGLWGTGRRPELIGQPVARFGRTMAAGAGATIDFADSFSGVEPGSGFQPVYVTGDVRGDRVGELVVGVNGRIATVTEVVRGAGLAGFAAVFDPALLRRGVNRIEVLALSGGSTPALAPLAQTGGASGGYSLAGNTIRGPRGRDIRIENGAVAGFVDRTRRDDAIVRVTGWAAQSRSFAPVERVLAFVDGKLRYSGRPIGPRPDIARQKGVTPDDLAFGFHVATSLISRGREPIQVYGVKNGRASRLEWFCGSADAQQVGC